MSKGVSKGIILRPLTNPDLKRVKIICKSPEIFYLIRIYHKSPSVR